MREIKFRAWYCENMCEVDVINWEERQILLSCEKVGIQEWFDLDKVILLQYTGLKDKNGKEIYEGDICSGHSDGNGVIKWSKYDGGYNYEFDDENVVGIWEVLNDIRTIGTIYENPELLTNPKG